MLGLVLGLESRPHPELVTCPGQNCIILEELSGAKDYCANFKDTKRQVANVAK